MNNPHLKWVRSPDGAIAGVCKGLAASLDLNLGALRLVWIASVLFMGTGIPLYLLLAIALPRTDRLDLAMKKKFLGVCLRISQRTSTEIGLVRLACLLLALMSLGTSLLIYIILAFVLPEAPEEKTTPQTN